MRSRCRKAVDQSADGNRHHEIGSRLAVSLAVGALTSWLGFQNRLEKEIGQLVDVVVGTENDITSIASITTVRTAFRNKLFTAEAGGTIASVTRLRMHPDSINEHLATFAEAWRKVAQFCGQSHPIRRAPQRASFRQPPFEKQAQDRP